MVGGAVIVASHSVVSSVFDLVAARAFLPVRSGTGRTVAECEPAPGMVR